MPNDEPSPAEIDRHLRAHALNMAIQINGMSGPQHFIMAMHPQNQPNAFQAEYGCPGDIEIPPPVGRIHPTARSVLEDARLIHEFLRGTGNGATPLRVAGDETLKNGLE